MTDRKEELERYLALYGRGTIPVETLDQKANETRAYIVTLERYRNQITEELQRVDLWEREIASILEALAALQIRLNAGVSWDDKRALVKDLVAGIVIETRTAEDGESFPVAHVTYRFEQPVHEIPIPAELVSPFGDILTKAPPHATIRPSKSGGTASLSPVRAVFFWGGQGECAALSGTRGRSS